MLIDDFNDANLTSRLGMTWRAVTDRVMGGVSSATLSHHVIHGRRCLRLRGDVRLDNNGGFVQAALDLVDNLDASGYSGVRLIARGNGEEYSVHLRTPDAALPWQSYRAQFTAVAKWRTIDLAFNRFAPYRLNAPLDIKRLCRIGLVAIGRAFYADLAVSELSLYR